jgi:WD40 repeat protein
VTASFDGIARVWNLSDLQSTPVVLSGHTKAVRYAAFSPDGRKVVTASDDGTARVWDLSEVEETWRAGATAANPIASMVLAGHLSILLQAEFSPDGKVVFTTSADDSVRVWDVSSPRLRARILHVGPGRVEFATNGKGIVAARDGTLLLWDIADLPSTPFGEIIDLRPTSFGKPGVRHYNAAFSPDGKQVVAGASDGIVRVYNLSDLREPPVEHLGNNQERITSARFKFSADGRRVLATSLLARQPQCACGTGWERLSLF